MHARAVPGQWRCSGTDGPQSGPPGPPGLFGNGFADTSTLKASQNALLCPHFSIIYLSLTQQCPAPKRKSTSSCVSTFVSSAAPSANPCPGGTGEYTTGWTGSGASQSDKKVCSLPSFKYPNSFDHLQIGVRCSNNKNAAKPIDM